MAVDIKAFLQPPVMNETKEVIISKRFKGADGSVAPFVIDVYKRQVGRSGGRQRCCRTYYFNESKCVGGMI